MALPNSVMDSGPGRYLRWPQCAGETALQTRYAMKIGILKTDAVRPEWVPDFGEYPDMFVALLGRADPDLEFVVYDVEEGIYPEDVDEVDAYLITGSKSSVYEDKQWITDLMAFVRELNARKKKLVGICFGHQIVAQALGGKTEKSTKGWGQGLHTHTFVETPDWHDDESADLHILVSHQDQGVQNAEGARVLASSEFCENAVVQIGKHILTFQGHPEFLPEYSREIMDYRREMIGEGVYASGVASLTRAQEGDRVARWILRFLKG